MKIAGVQFYILHSGITTIQFLHLRSLLKLLSPSLNKTAQFLKLSGHNILGSGI